MPPFVRAVPVPILRRPARTRTVQLLAPGPATTQRTARRPRLTRAVEASTRRRVRLTVFAAGRGPPPAVPPFPAVPPPGVPLPEGLPAVPPPGLPEGPPPGLPPGSGLPP